jgi:fermentation-respiration switch protein FrsA (DUF1100 family)
METTPEELGLQAETIQVTSSDGIPLQAWWIAAPEAKGIVVVLHGMDGTDASTMLGHARFLYDAGYSSLVLDMRAHGRSGGERIGLAFEEPRDVSAALDWVAAQPELRDQPLALLGLSMGGATALRTAAIRPEVDAVISVSAFASVDRVLGQGMRLMGAPEELIGIYTPFTRLAMLTLYGAWPSAASPERDIPSITPRPVLIAHGDADDQIPVENATLLKNAAGDNAELWIVPGAGHGAEILTPEAIRAVVMFFDKHLKGGAAAP